MTKNTHTTDCFPLMNADMGGRNAKPKPSKGQPSPAKYSVVLFDLDGTLLDTLDDLFSAVNHALKAYGLPTRTREEVRSFIGNGVVKLMERSVGAVNLPQDQFTKILEEFKSYYAVHCQDLTQPYAGILPMLNALKEQGIRTGVVSNKHDAAVKKLCKTYFDGLIDIAIGENEESGIKKKPAPDTLISAMHALKTGEADIVVDTQAVVYVGDSEVDIETAKNAGIDCISVAWGMKEYAFLAEHGASVIVNSVSALENLLCKRI